MSRGFLVNFCLTLVSIVFCLTLAEWGLRNLISKPQLGDRAMMWSEDLFEKQADSSVKYQANLKIREAAVYNGAIEFDTELQTNNLGYIDHEDYLKSNAYNKTFAVVGDSFAAGTGSTPWISSLRERMRMHLQDTMLFNLSLCGASIQHFQLNLEHFANDFDFDEILIIAISNDLHRVYWRPLTVDGQLRLCPKNESDETCLNRTPFARLIDYNSSKADILSVAKDMYHYQVAQQESQVKNNPIQSTVFKDSRVANMLYNFATDKPLFALQEQQQSISKAVKLVLEKNSWENLEKIKNRFSDKQIHFIHIPERHEVKNAKYDLELSAKLEEMRINYYPLLQTCQWDEQMFFPHDRHPNARGHKNTIDCLEKNYFSKLLVE